MLEQYSPELEALCAARNLLARSRISSAGRLAVGFAQPVQPKSGHPRKKGEPYEAGRWARTATRGARELFPSYFMQDDEPRYGQQGTLFGKVA